MVLILTSTLASIGLEAQVSDCSWILEISGDPIIDTFFEAEHLIHSGDTISQLKTTTFSAPNILLEDSFYVTSGAALTVDNSGCVAECEPSLDICSDPCTSPLEDDITTNSQRFVKHQAVITFPDSVLVDWSGGTTALSITFQQQTFSIDVADTLLKYLQVVDTNVSNRGFLKRCLCEKNIFLYENDNLIMDEGAIGVANGSGGNGFKGEGGAFSLNYILEYNEGLSPDSIADETLIKFKDRSNLNPATGAKIIAFLDSGLDPSLLLSNEKFLYINQGPGGYTCPMDGTTALPRDTFGWNFVENNNNLYDERGHGSLVTLSFIKALKNLNQGPSAFNEELIQILTVKVLNECGEGTTYSTTCGLNYAQMKGASIVNTSWGMYQEEFQLQRAVYEVTDKGSVIVASSGNIGADLDSLSHFPSGYSALHEHFEGRPDTSSMKSGNARVYEVGGACRSVADPCSIQRINLPLDASSNHRDTLFVESSRNIEQLLPLLLRPTCEIQGTSYASPIFGAGLYNELIKKGTLSKAHMFSKSKKIHPEKEDWSYFLNNCN